MCSCFHRISKAFMTMNGIDERTYVVYFGNPPPDDVTSIVKELFAGCAKKFDAGHENRYVHVRVHRACGHDHLGSHRQSGYNGPVLVMEKPPTAVEFSVKITAEWILYYSNFSDCFQERILDPLAKEFGPISLTGKSYVVACPPDKAQKIRVFLEEELRKALLSHHNLSGEIEEHAKTGTFPADVSSHYHANTPLATQSDKLKLSLDIWNYLKEHLSDKLAYISNNYSCQINPQHHDNNYVMIEITAQKHHMDALTRDFLQLVDTLAAEYVKIDLNNRNLSTDIGKLMKKYIGVKIEILQNESSLLIVGPKEPVHKIKQSAPQAFPALAPVQVTPMDHSGLYEADGEPVTTHFRTGPISSMEAEGAFRLKFFFRPKIMVTLYKESLLSAHVDVIISPANTTLTAKGGIAKKLAEVAGPRYVNGCKNYIDRKGPLDLGDTIDTLSGNLPKPIRGVVHAVCQPTKGLSQKQIEITLQDAIFKSLKMTDERCEAHTVALPPLGGTNNSPEIVAECLLKAICKFNEHTLSSKRSSNLKEIHITSHTKEMNEKMITLMTHGIHQLSPPEQVIPPRHLPQEEVPLLLQTQGPHKTRVRMATPPSSPPVQITQSATGHIMRLMANDRLRVEIYQANLVKQKTDAIVNPANNRLQHDAGAARAIAEAAGPLLVQECTDYIRRYKEVPVTETMHTTAGNLRPDVKIVIHAVGPFWNEQLKHQSFQEIRDTFLNTLVCANKLQCRSVSIPAISSGIFGVPLDVVGQAAFCAIIRYEEIQQPPHYLREVHLVNIDEPTTMSLKKTFETAVKKQFDENGRATVTMVMIDDDPVKGKVTEPPLHILQSAQGPNALIGRAVGQMDTAQPDKEITPQVKSHKSSGTRVRTVQDSSHEVPHTGATQASQLWMKTSEDVDLYIHQGSIENQSTEAIVNVTSMSVLRKEGVSKHILAKAGGEVEEELIKFIKANGNPKEGQCIHTSAGGGGGLPQVFYIIHVVAPSIDTASMDKLVNTLINILSYANTKLKASSIALPFFVTDNKENEEKLCKACIDGVLYYSRSLPANNRHLLKVHLVHPKVSTVMTMRSFFKTNAINQMLITGTGMQLIQDSLSENGTSSRSTSAMNTTSPAQDREVKLHRTPESRMAKWMHLQTDEGLSVLVRHANIVEFEADAVVCMVDQNATIMTAAGKGMRQEYDDFFKLHAPLQDREVVRTSAGNMTPRVKHILHVKCPDYQPGCDSVRSLREAFYQCLTSANDHHAASISLPPLGVDTHGFTVMDTATAAYGAILAFSYGIRNKSTRCINLLHTDSTIMDEIQTAFRQLIEDQLNGKVRFCSQMFIKEEGDEFNNPPNPPPLLNEEARVIKRIEDQKRMHDLSWSETCSQPARRTRHRNSHMSLDTGLDSDISTQNKPVRLQSGGKPAIMPPLTAGNKRVSKTPQTHAPRNVPIRVIHKPDSPPLPLGSEKGSRSRDRQPREAEHVLASNRHQPVQRRRSSSMSRASTPSSDSGFCSTCGSSAKLVARTKCKHTWCEACRKKNSHCKAKACVKERK